MAETARKQGVGRSGVAPPKDRQFGQPNGNPRHSGAWKKEDSLRFKWEQMLKLDDEELWEIMNNPKASRVERITAEVLLDNDMKPTDKLTSLEKLANQVYGFPKQVNENRNLEITPILPMKKDKK